MVRPRRPSKTTPPKKAGSSKQRTPTAAAVKAPPAPPDKPPRPVTAAPQRIVFLTTRELGAQLGIAAETIRKRLNDTGSYYGLRPEHLPNGRMLWPADSVAQLVTTRRSVGRPRRGVVPAQPGAAGAV